MTEKSQNLQEIFLETIDKTLCPDSPEMIDEVIQEVQWQVYDWYNGESYYNKPEDILQDYLFLSAKQAHDFLPLFKEGGAYA